MIIILNRFYFCESRSSSFAYDFFPPSCPQFPLVPQLSTYQERQCYPDSNYHGNRPKRFYCQREISLNYISGNKKLKACKNPTCKLLFECMLVSSSCTVFLNYAFTKRARDTIASQTTMPHTNVFTPKCDRFYELASRQTRDEVD